MESNEHTIATIHLSSGTASEIKRKGSNLTGQLKWTERPPDRPNRSRGLALIVRSHTLQKGKRTINGIDYLTGHLQPLLRLLRPLRLPLEKLPDVYGLLARMKWPVRSVMAFAAPGKRSRRNGGYQAAL